MLPPKPLTDDELKEVIAKLDKLCDESDVSVVRNIFNYQQEHTRYMGRKYSRFMNQFEMYFSAIVDAGLNINYLNKKEWPTYRGFQFVIATHSLKQFFSAYTLLNGGAYEDAINLLRSVYESFLRIVFASCNPAHAYNAYKMKGQSGPEFNATGLVNDELKLDWNSYKIMSYFSHSNQFRVVETMAKLATEGQTEAITLDYKSDDDMISVVVNSISFLMMVYLKLFSEVFTVDISKHKNKDTIKKHLDLLSEYAEVSTVAVKNHSNNKYWRQVGSDVERIFELIHFMDQNPTANWKKQWAVINKN